MSSRIIEVHTHVGAKTAEKRLMALEQALHVWPIEAAGRKSSFSLLIHLQDTQAVTDRLQTMFSKEELSRIVILPVEAVLPPIVDEVTEAEKKKKKSQFAGVSREELYESLSEESSLDLTFVLLVIFSTIVAAIGLIENNVAVVIGAMVIAPLLGPNIAFALATALGDHKLMAKSLLTTFVGICVCFLISVMIGFFWPYSLDSDELLSRTDVGFSGMALAFVSGAAAVLSLTTGLSKVLVGVMVAVALLPPTVTLGIMMGAQRMDDAIGAGLLLAVNIVCINLAAKLVLLFKRVEPRTWYERQVARRSMAIYIAFWAFSLLLLALLIGIRSYWLGELY